MNDVLDYMAKRTSKQIEDEQSLKLNDSKMRVCVADKNKIMIRVTSNLVSLRVEVLIEIVIAEP